MARWMARDFLWTPQYNTKYSYDEPVKRSSSHHSLPVTHSQTMLKHTPSQPVRTTITKTKSKPNERSFSKENGKPVEKPKNHQPTSNNQTGGSVQAALQLIANEDWNHKVDGLNMIVQPNVLHSKAMDDNYKEVLKAVISECKNLRSGVSRVAISALGTLFETLRNKIDSEVEKSCHILMQKTGDVSNAFIREDAAEALEKLCKCANPSKTLAALISAGSSSKNNTIRASCALFIHKLVERLGSNNILNNPDQLSQILPYLIAFSKDQNPNVRNNGRQALFDLSQNPHFERLLRKNVSDSQYKTAMEIVNTIEKKGGIDSLDSTLNLSQSFSRSASMKRNSNGVNRKLKDTEQLDLDECRKLLTASEWETRLSGIKMLTDLCKEKPKPLSTDTKLVEAFIGRLSDINGKVSAKAMETYLDTLPTMSKYYSSESNLKAVQNQLVLSLMSHLSSKSDEHKQLAKSCLKETIRHSDSATMLTAVTAAMKKANVKQKPFMLNLLSSLCQQMYQSKPKQVELLALPVLYNMLKTPLGDIEVKKAVTNFAKTLKQLIGEQIVLEGGASDWTPAKRKTLEGIIQ